MKIRIARFLITLSIAAATAACTTPRQYYLEVKPGVKDYVSISCAPEGNPLGFSLEFPRCYCNGGILLTYIVEPKRNEYTSRFELKRGYLYEGGVETVVVSLNGRTIDHMTAGVEKITSTDSPEIWRGNQRGFTALMNTFGARLYEVETMCRAEQNVDWPLTMTLEISDPL